MNRIILIGNGFDLAHGLKTSYTHFIDDYWEKKTKAFYDALTDNKLIMLDHNDGLNYYVSDKVYKFQDNDIVVYISNNYKFVFYNSKADEDKTGFQNFSSYISNFKPDSYQCNYWMNNLFLQQITEKSLVNWVNIEREYYLALNECLDGKRDGGIEQLNDEFSRIQIALEEYLETQIISGKKYSDLIAEKMFYPLLRNGKFEETKEKWENILILDFNYTKTTDFYRQQYIPQKNIHIHGELGNPENPIIFGYGDEMDEKSKLIENKNEKEYLINNKSINYLQTNNYQELLAFINADEYEIFVMGHSCGISDITLLNTLFEHKNCTKIKPFYYKRENGTDDYNDIVINIYRNFEDKKKCRARVAPRTKCEPLPQSKKP
jgi:hypothetical protein